MRALLFNLMILIMTTTTFAGRPPYPIIFIHGLAPGHDGTFAETMEYLVGEDDKTYDWSTQYNWGSGVNVFDVVLNADDNNETAMIDLSGQSGDVRWESFIFDGDIIQLGQRLFQPDVDPTVVPYLHWWHSDSYVFAVNFDELRIEGANRPFNPWDHFVPSNQSAIYKQGLAVREVIREVLNFTSAEKVILVGHSMGGLAIREYLQRKENGDRKWWLDPAQDDGHHVAKVVTIGTPHLGSNFVSPRNSDRDNVPNNDSEAMRDLRYSYGDIGGWGPDPTRDEGKYLFGGNEWDLRLFDYWNLDINCNGSVNDDIIGLNANTLPTAENPAMSLPTNVEYTWIVGREFDGSNDDGVVRCDRQYLASTGDRFEINGLSHWEEGSAYQFILRGLDEPDTPEFAWTVLDCCGWGGTSPNVSVQGVICRRDDVEGSMLDVDCFKIVLDEYGALTTTLSGGEGVDGFALLDEAEQSIASDFAPPFQIDRNLLAGTYFVRLVGEANATSYQNPYTLTCQFDPIEIEANFVASPVSGEAPLTVQFANMSTGPITQCSWDFDNDGVTDSQVYQPSWVYQNPGHYTVKLTVGDGIGSEIEVKSDYIHVNQPQSESSNWVISFRQEVLLLHQLDGEQLNDPVIAHTFPEPIRRAGIIDVNLDENNEIVVVLQSGVIMLGSGGEINNFVWTEIAQIGTINSTDADLAIGDLTGDGYPDFVVSASDGDRRLFLLINTDGTGAFINHTFNIPWFNGSFWLSGFDCGDMDEDGDIDIMIANYSGPIYLMRNDGSGVNFIQSVAFTNENPGGTPCLRVADFTNDGHLDVLVGLDDDGDPGQSWVYPGTGDGTFSPRIESLDMNPSAEGGSNLPASLIWLADYNLDDGDDYVDAIGPFWNGSTMKTAIYRGNGNGTFMPPIIFDGYYYALYDFGYRIITPPTLFHSISAQLAVTVPSGESVWCTASDCEPSPGVSCFVQWQIVGPSDNVGIDLIQDGVAIQSLLDCTAGLPGSSGGTWVTLRSSDAQGQPMVAADNYQVRVRFCNSEISDESSLFSIKWLSIENPGLLFIGDEFLATWSSSYNMTDSISIQLYDGCNWGPVIATGIPVSNGQVSCQIPQYVQQGSNYALGIFNTHRNTVWDFCPGNFIVSQQDSSCVPMPITNLAAHIENQIIYLSWTPPIQTIWGFPVTISDYDIYVSSDPWYMPSVGTYFATVSANAFSFQLESTLDAKLFFRVIANGTCSLMNSKAQSERMK